MFNEDLHRCATRRMQLEMELREILEEHEFRLLFQPIVRPDGTTSGCEALIRWETAT